MLVRLVNRIGKWVAKSVNGVWEERILIFYGYKLNKVLNDIFLFVYLYVAFEIIKEVS